MTETKQRHFLFGTDISVCAEPRRRFCFYLWNYGMLILSAVGLCFLTLLLGVGDGGRELLLDYFRHPLIFFLNFLHLKKLHLIDLPQILLPKFR